MLVALAANAGIGVAKLFAGSSGLSFGGTGRSVVLIEGLGMECVAPAAGPSNGLPGSVNAANLGLSWIGPPG